MNNADNPEARPPRGLAGDIHRARTGVAATAGELRQFVDQLRGRSPQEMLGIVAGSSLFRSTFLATVITVVLLVAFTAGPYAWKKMYPAKESEKADATAAAAPTAAPATAAPTAAAPASGAAPVAGSPTAPTSPVAGPAGPADPLSKLGVAETKNADPKKNPLDNSKDDLLKDLK